ncbi:MAG: zf-HC2 domain-containing protein [Nitriliruptoraceae bacterium]
MVERHISGTRLSVFLDDELDDDEALTITRHLDRCTRCLGELDGIRAARDALRALPSLQAPVLLRGAPARQARRRRGHRRRVGLVMAVVIVPLAAGGALYLAGAERGDVAPQTELFLVEHVTRTGGGPLPVPIAGDGR